MKPQTEIIPVEVFSGSIIEAEMLKNMFESESIESYLKDEFTGSLAPWYTSPGGVSPVKVVVSSLDVEKAKQIIKDFMSNK